MKFTEIAPEESGFNPFTDWSKYILVTAGQKEKCNTLLVTWGTFGQIWRKKSLPFIYGRAVSPKHSWTVRTISPCPAFPKTISRK